MNIDIHNSVFVMSSESWDKIKKNTYGNAIAMPDPILYVVRKLGNIDVVIDDKLPFGVIESYNKDFYYNYIDKNSNDI